MHGAIRWCVWSHYGYTSCRGAQHRLQDVGGEHGVVHTMHYYNAVCGEDFGGGVQQIDGIDEETARC